MSLLGRAFVPSKLDRGGPPDQAGGGVGVTGSKAHGLNLDARGGGVGDAASAYRVNYDTISDTSLSSDATIARPDPQWNVQHDLTVNVEGQNELPAGEYRDTVTVTIAGA